jgi:glycosyltransferase involved in cell wall biosynthesis
MLARRFPNRLLGFSLLYILSNAIYLSRSVIGAVASAGVPIVLNQNGVYYPAWYPQDWKHENARMAYVHETANHVLYQSEFCRRCAQKFLGERAGPSTILYNAVDTETFVPAEMPLAERAFTFLVTGKFGNATAYRLTASIEGLAAARKGGLDIRLRIAGLVDPIVEKQMRALVDRLAVVDTVDWTGPYAHGDAPEIYRSADAYLMLKHNDPCPNVVIEAMACGLPVLYSASGGVPELVGEEAGIALPVPDTFEYNPAPNAQAVAQGMAHIIASRDTMSRLSRQRALARFSLTAWLDRHGALFAQLVSGARV